MNKENNLNTRNLKNDCDATMQLLLKIGATCESFINDCEHTELITESLDKLAKVPANSHTEIIAKLDLLLLCTWSDNEAWLKQYIESWRILDIAYIRSNSGLLVEFINEAIEDDFNELERFTQSLQHDIKKFTAGVVDVSLPNKT